MHHVSIRVSGVHPRLEGEYEARDYALVIGVLVLARDRSAEAFGLRRHGQQALGSVTQRGEESEAGEVISV